MSDHFIALNRGKSFRALPRDGALRVRGRD